MVHEQHSYVAVVAFFFFSTYLLLLGRNKGRKKVAHLEPIPAVFGQRWVHTLEMLPGYSGVQ